MKLIAAALAITLTPAYATEKTDQSPLLCDFFGLLCPNEDEEDGDWGDERDGGGGGSGGGAVDAKGGQGPVDPKAKQVTIKPPQKQE